MEKHRSLLDIDGKYTGRLFTLWDIMNLFNAIELALVIRDLARYRSECQASLNAVPGSPTILFITTIEVFLEHHAKPLCEKLKLSGATAKIALTLDYWRQDNSRTDMSSLDADLRNIEDLIMNDCFRIKFVHVNLSLADYLDKDSLFGNDVANNFPSAREDIKNAGNCLAVELPTAAVFHLMCVVEWGLRAFAVDLGLLEISVGRKNNKTKPIEYAQWEQILNQLPEKIRAKIDSISEWSQKQKAQEFYHPAKLEI